MNDNKKKALISIKKAKTSLEKIILMVEKDEYCGDVIVQNMAAIWLIKSSNNKLIEAFLENCSDNISQEKRKEEILKIFKLSHK